MVSLVTKAAEEVRSRGGKRVTAAHLKQAVLKEEQFDFLADVIAKAPDMVDGTGGAGGGADANGDDVKRSASMSAATGTRTRRPRKQKSEVEDDEFWLYFCQPLEQKG